ncbi:hypothetical protein TNCV_2187171 [Trichonephila clavipes]|nr:hypothetical protein TNCV_2187171 [Trichonephila clavipes]
MPIPVLQHIKAKEGNSLGSDQVLRYSDHNSQSSLWLSKTFRVLGHGRIFVNVCGDSALCSSEGQRDFRLSQLGSLLGFLASPFIAGDPNRTWDPLQDRSPLGDICPFINIKTKTFRYTDLYG